MDKQVVKKPWGSFEQFCLNEKVTVKILNVNPNSELSLQYHHNREEFWKVIEGSGFVFINDKFIESRKGEEFFIKKLEKHTIKTEKEMIKILEISFGEFDEMDIVRLEDKYGRK